jgi:hypothetical protein
MRKNLSVDFKREIAGKQHFKCANRPGSNLRGLQNYQCPLWKMSTDRGSFDQAGYNINHIVEFSVSKDDSKSNLQALCPSCHACKTQRFQTSRKNIGGSKTAKKNVKKRYGPCKDRNRTFGRANSKNNIIDIVPFGTDGLDSLTSQEIKSIFGDKNGIIIGLLKHINFNPDKNVHHNIFFSHIKNGFVRIYTDHWEDLHIADALSTIIAHKLADAKNLFHRVKQHCVPEKIASIQKLLNKITYRTEARRVKIFLSNSKENVWETYKLTQYQWTESKTDESELGADDWDFEAIDADIQKPIKKSTKKTITSDE